MRRWFVSSQAFFILAALFLLNAVLDFGLGQTLTGVVALILVPLLCWRAMQQKRKGL